MELQNLVKVLEEEKRLALEQLQEVSSSSSQQIAVHQKRIKALEDERSRLEREVENLEKSINESLNNNNELFNNNNDDTDGWKIERRLFTDDNDIEGGGGVRVRNNNNNNNMITDSEDIKKSAYGLQNILLKVYQYLPDGIKQKLPKTDNALFLRLLKFYLIFIHFLVLYHMIY